MKTALRTLTLAAIVLTTSLPVLAEDAPTGCNPHPPTKAAVVFSPAAAALLSVFGL